MLAAFDLEHFKLGCACKVKRYLTRSLMYSKTAYLPSAGRVAYSYTYTEPYNTEVKMATGKLCSSQL
jgi:hypothetical protein